jgi:hypothetical protein
VLKAILKVALEHIREQELAYLFKFNKGPDLINGFLSQMVKY